MFGVPLLVFFEIYSFEQIALVIRGSGFAVFALATLLFILWYFNRFSRPWFAYIRQPNEVNSEQARSQLRRFSLHYWGLFIITMGVRPSYILLSADSILGLDSAPVDWLRLHLVLLVVFILIGLPFFLRITDLLGLLLGGLVLERPRLTIRTKIFTSSPTIRHTASSPSTRRATGSSVRGSSSRRRAETAGAAKRWRG